MMMGLGSQVDYQTWLDYGGDPLSIQPAAAGNNYGGLMDIIAKSSFALAAEQLKKPLYQTQTTPSGSMTTVYGQGTGLNYPGGQGPTKVPIEGVSVTTMLMLGIAAMTLLVIMKK